MEYNDGIKVVVADASHEKYVGMVYHPRDTWYHLRKTVLDSMWYISKRLKDED